MSVKTLLKTRWKWALTTMKIMVAVGTFCYLMIFILQSFETRRFKQTKDEIMVEINQLLVETPDRDPQAAFQLGSSHKYSPVSCLFSTKSTIKSFTIEIGTKNLPQCSSILLPSVENVRAKRLLATLELSWAQPLPLLFHLKYSAQNVGEVQ